MPKKQKHEKKKPGKKKAVKRCSHPTTSNITKKNAPESKRSIFRRISWIFWNIFGAIGVYLTIWVVFNPNIFVYTSYPLDRNNPVLTPFVTRNQGYLAIYDVKFEWKMNYLITDTGIIILAEKEFENTFSDPNQVARVIAPGEEYTMRPVFSGLKYNKFEHMDIAIVLSFRPFKWWPWRHERWRRFVSKEGTDGQWHWFPMPIKK